MRPATAMSARRSAGRSATPKTVQVCCGHWETQVIECPGPVVRKCVQEPGCWVWDPCRCCCVYCPGECQIVEVQCPPRQICKKVWVPEVCEKTIQCVRYERETCMKQVPYTVCRMVPEQCVRPCCYKVCRMVPEQCVKTVCYKVCRMVPEQCVKTVNYTVCRMVPEQCVKTVCYKVCRMVPEKCVKTVCYKVCRMVPETVRQDGVLTRSAAWCPSSASRPCCYRVCRMVPGMPHGAGALHGLPHGEGRVRQAWCRTRSASPSDYTRCIRVPRCVSQCVPYTVTRCVPRTVCYRGARHRLLPASLPARLPTDFRAGLGVMAPAVA